jgi:hypothetical protein
METSEELLSRYERVKKEHAKVVKSYERMNSGPARERKARWAGCLYFTVLSIESELRERGLD